MSTHILISEPRLARCNNYISPGRVGSVGDTNMQVRLKQSNPDMRMRYDPMSAQNYETKFGSNVQDGATTSHDGGGGPARLIDTSWSGERDEKTSVGWIHQDLRNVDRVVQPTVGATPSYNWTNRLATVYRERHVNPNFLPLPGGYSLPLGEIPANGSGPVITNVIRPIGYPADQPRESGVNDYTDYESFETGGLERRIGREQAIRQEYLVGKAPQRPRRVMVHK